MRKTADYVCSVGEQRVVSQVTEGKISPDILRKKGIEKTKNDVIIHSTTTESLQLCNGSFCFHFQEGRKVYGELRDHDCARIRQWW